MTCKEPRKCPYCGATKRFQDGGIDDTEHGRYQHCHGCGRDVLIEKW